MEDINYETSKIKSKISLQDVRFIGNDVVKTETSLFGLHEGWVRNMKNDEKFPKWKGHFH